MNEMERLMPSKYAFEVAAKEGKDFLDDKIATRMREQADSVIDLLDRSHDWVESSYITDREFGWYFLGIDFHEHPDAIDVMVRAAKFALQIADDLSPMKISEIDIKGYLDTLRDDPEGPTDALNRAAQGYLQECDELDTILHVYAMDIDVTDNFTQQSQTVSAMMLMLAERWVAEEYLKMRVTYLSMEDFLR